MGGLRKVIFFIPPMNSVMSRISFSTSRLMGYLHIAHGLGAFADLLSFLQS